MDAFRRFRSRRTSKAQADSFTTFADAESSYVSSSGPWLAPTQSSGLASRPSDAASLKVSQDVSRLPKSPTDSNGPNSSGRVQPMLIGISRPLNNNAPSSRPGTAGSMQRALDQAAEAVAHTSPIRSTTASPTTQLGLKTGKFVDIFAIASQGGHTVRSYNEDVAQRNLGSTSFGDVDRDFRYKPTSKFQEEVAARNAYQITGARTSSLQRSSEETFGRNAVLSALTPQRSTYTHSSPAPSEQGKSKPQHLPHDGGAYHSRQHSTRTRDVPDQLPPIPQENSTEDVENTLRENNRSPDEIEKELDRAKARWLEVRRQNRGHEIGGRDKPLPASPQPSSQLRDSGISSLGSDFKRVSDLSNTGRITSSNYGNEHYSTGAATNPERLSTNSNVQTGFSRGSVQTNSSVRTNTIGDGFRRSDRLRPHSSTSAHSYKRTFIGNRTIMDLTGDEDEEYQEDVGAGARNGGVGNITQEPKTDSQSLPSYQHTPVLENARTDALKRMTPTVVDFASIGPPLPKVREFESAVPNARWSSAQEPVLDLDQLARQSQAMQETAKAAVLQKDNNTNVGLNSSNNELRAANFASSKARLFAPLPATTSSSSTLAFSPVQTLSSSSPPRQIAFSPINIMVASSPRSSQEMLVIDQNRATAQPNSSASSLQVDDAEQRRKRASARISANIAPLVKIFADVRPEDQPVTGASLNSLKAESSTSQKEPSKAKSTSKTDSKKPERRAEKKAIRLAAQSIIPAGPLDQELSTGIKTRDFALMPLEKPTNKRVEALSERKRTSPPRSESSKALRQSTRSSRSSSSGERKSRSRPSKSGSEDAPKVSAKALGKLPEKDTEKQPRSTTSASKKSSKSKSSSRKKRPVSKFDEDAYKKKHAEANAALLRLQQSLQENFDESVRPESTTPRASGSPAAQALTPAAKATSVPNSPSAAAALAMISAATTTPRAKAQADAQAARAATQSNSVPSTSVLPPPPPLPMKREPSLRESQDDGSNVVSRTLLAPMNPTLGRIDGSNKPPPSPGEVSLSSFPLPTHGSPEPAKSPTAPPAYVKDVGMPTRRGSQGSRASTASAFSIPFTMVPSRLASLPEKRMGFAGPSTTPTMESIASVIPPTKPEVTSW